jgi:hypothetical protein
MPYFAYKLSSLENTHFEKGLKSQEFRHKAILFDL